VWLTPHLRDPQPEGERERERERNARERFPEQVGLSTLMKDIWIRRLDF